MPGESSIWLQLLRKMARVGGLRGRGVSARERIRGRGYECTVRTVTENNRLGGGEGEGGKGLGEIRDLRVQEDWLRRYRRQEGLCFQPFCFTSARAANGSRHGTPLLNPTSSRPNPSARASKRLNYLLV